jgi:hypothetical protein
MFVSECGVCHTMQAAETSGTIGPDLDNAFAASRDMGFPSSTIENLVLDMIRLGSGPIATYTAPEHGVEGLTPQPTMPKNGATGQVTGQNAIDVAAYVASVAGVSGFSTTRCDESLGLDGLTIFKACGCAGCHTLNAAGASGTIGPDLDELKPSEDAVDNQVTTGSSGMPAFKGKLTTAQILAVAKYVSSVAGK